MRVLQCLRAPSAIVRVASAVVFVAFALCAASQSSARARRAGGHRFSGFLGEIGDFYVGPVATRRVAVAGAGRLARFASRLVGGDMFGGAGGPLAVSYDSRHIGYLA